MEKSIYTPLSGALAQERALELIANNLANLNTVGFKGDRQTFTLLEAEPEKRYTDPLPPANFKVGIEQLQHIKGNEILHVGVADVRRDKTQGPAIQTQNPTDVMIEGDGMLAVMTPDGERYTRNGTLTLSRDGILVSQEGHPVLGEKGNIALHSGPFMINDSGEVWQDKRLVDRIQLFAFDEDQGLERAGLNLFHYGGAPEGKHVIANPQMRQGWVEGSNVNPIKNLTDMIIAHRSYEAYQKAVANYDSMMNKSSNSIGEVRA
jgi:flagellar basal-body rod protein FlgG